MPADQIVIGSLIAGLCGLGLWHRDWLLNETRKGRWLVQRWGRQKAIRVLTIVLIVGFGAGVLLVCNILRPLRW